MCNENETLQILSLACWSQEQFRSKTPAEIEKVLNVAFKEQTEHWRILPLIHKNLITAGLFNKLSPALQQALKATTQKAVANNMAMKSQFREVLSLFEEINLPCIMLKGAAFASWIYDDEYPRGSRDIDILVKERDFERAKSLLLTIMDSYVQPDAGPLIGLYEESFKPRGKSGMAIDLHRAITYPGVFNINEDELWGRSVKHPKLSSNKIRMLSIEDNITHQAIHCCRDFDFKRYSLVDYHYLKTLSDVNSLHISKHAQMLGCYRVLSLFLSGYACLEHRISSSISNRESKSAHTKFVEWLLKVKRTSRYSFVTRLTQAILICLLPDKNIGGIKLCGEFIFKAVKT